MKFKPVKIGVIGCGVISDTYMNNLKNTFSITDLYACADLVDSKSDRRAEQYQIKKMSNEELLSDKEIDIVANLTYASAHYEVTKQILDAGKHCYSEKMLANSLDEADELYSLAKANGLMLACAPDTFLGASLQTTRYIIDKGLIGKPLIGTVLLTRFYQLIKTDQNDAERRFSVVRQGGGIPYDMGGYYLNALFNLFGPVKAVSGVCCTNDKIRPYLNPRHSLFDEDFVMDTENYMCGTLEFANGFCANIAITSDCATSQHAFTIVGTEGILYMPDPNNFGDKVYIQRVDGEKHEFPLVFPYNDKNRGIGIADMAWALRTERTPRISAEMSCHGLEVVKGLVKSFESGKKYTTKYTFDRPVPLASGILKNGAQERSLYLYGDENV